MRIKPLVWVETKHEQWGTVFIDAVTVFGKFSILVKKHVEGFELCQTPWESRVFLHFDTVENAKLHADILYEDFITEYLIEE